MKDVINRAIKVDNALSTVVAIVVRLMDVISLVGLKMETVFSTMAAIVVSLMDVINRALKVRKVLIV